MRSRLKSLHTFTWLIAVLLAAWILSHLSFSELLRSIAELTPLQWAAWVMLNLLIIGLLTVRWLVLTRAMQLSPGFMQILMVRQAGQLVSFITPGPQFGGEPLQVYWLWKRYFVPGHAALLAVSLDRFYELWINFAVLLAAVLLLLASSATAFVDWVEIAVMLIVLILILSTLAWTSIRQPDRVIAWVRQLSRRWQNHSRLRNLQAHWNSLADRLRELAQWQKPQLLFAFLLSLLGWVGIIAELWLLLSFFNVTPTLFEFIFLLVAIRLAFLLPLPGGIGSLEATLFWAFQVLGLPVASAAGLIVLMRLRDIVILLAGMFALRGLQPPESPLVHQS